MARWSPLSLLLFLALVVPVDGQQDAEGWRRVAPNDIGFEVQIPPTPTIGIRSSGFNANGQKLRISLLTCETKDGDELFVGGLQLPAGGRKISNEEFFNSIKKGFELADGEVQIAAGKRMTTSSVAGMEFKLTGQAGQTGFMRVYRLPKDQIALIGIAGDVLAADSPITVKFFKSFKTLPEGDTVVTRFKDLIPKTPAPGTNRPRLPSGARERAVTVSGKAAPPPSLPLDLPDPKSLPGLVAYWDFDEGTGTTAGDQGPARAQGTVQSGTWIDGVRGKALRLSGEPSCVQLKSTPELTFKAGQAFTVTGWFRFADRRSGAGPVVAFRNAQDGGSVLAVQFRMLGRIHAQVRCDGRESSAPTEVAATEAIAPGHWNHFALQRTSGGEVRFFVNGSLVGSSGEKASLGPITTNLQAFGCERYWQQSRRSTLGTWFAGDLDEICFFNRALTDEEVRQLAGQAK